MIKKSESGSRNPNQCGSRWIRIRISKTGSCNISIPILPVEHGPDVVGIARLVLDGVVSVRIELDQNDDAVGRLGQLVRCLLSCCLPRTGLTSGNIRQGFQHFTAQNNFCPVTFYLRKLVVILWFKKLDTVPYICILFQKHFASKYCTVNLRTTGTGIRPYHFKAISICALCRVPSRISEHKLFLEPVLGIRDILMRIRIPGSVPLTNRSGSNSANDSFLQWL